MVSHMRRETGNGKTNTEKKSPHTDFLQITMLNKEHKTGQQRRKIWQHIE